MGVDIYLLTIDYNEFLNNLSKFIKEGEAMLVIQNISEEEYLKFETKYDQWIEKCNAFLRGSFKGSNDLIKGFQPPYTRLMTNSQLSINQKENNTKRSIAHRVHLLKAIITYSGICDLIQAPKTVNLSVRTSLSIEEKENFLLEKFNKLYSAPDYYSIKIILEGNGIPLMRQNEEMELVEKWVKLGYLEISPFGNSDNAKITLSGAKHMQSVQKESNKPSEEEISEINQKIDDVIEKLEKLGLGQEIIFDEIEELKELYLKLSKKNWKHIVMGKIIDIGLAKLVEKDTLQYIYNHLTNDVFKLP